jgi:hypothetical protein
MESTAVKPPWWRRPGFRTRSTARAGRPRCTRSGSIVRVTSARSRPPVSGSTAGTTASPHTPSRINSG